MVINYVNYLKVFGILMVVIGHTNFPYNNFIYSFHMPLFFFISGYFLKDISIKEEIVKGYKRYLIPYLIFGIISIILGNLKQLLLGQELFRFKNSFFALINGMSLEYVKTYGFVLWFLLALFFGRIIVVFLNKVIRSQVGIILLLIVAGKISIMFKSPFCISQGILAAFWINFGYLYFKKIKEKLQKKEKTGIILGILILVFVKIPILDLANLKIDNYFYYLIYNTFILIGIDLFFSNFENSKSKPIEFISKNTIFIFIFHTYTNNIGYIISKGNWFLTTSISLIILIIGIIIYQFIKNKIFERILKNNV